ncbi:pentapeptide repeat-containing protein [Pseudonocardiaceae bacterium YIM PH 21723]|nr:pentapeptide repeat-containing protein [Pseudonocardiaceae bacterium YIM PH 21723]
MTERRQWLWQRFGLLAGLGIIALLGTLGQRYWDLVRRIDLLSAAIVAGGLLVLVVVLISARRPVATRRPIAPISLKVVLLAVGAVVVATWLSIVLLLREANNSTGDRAAARIDAIRTALSVGAGTGGAMALLLATRKQWLGERSQEHAEHDAGERRFTDLYSATATQLSSDKAPVRMAAMFALERLAQNSPQYQQTIANLICGYLRCPFDPPAHVRQDSRRIDGSTDTAAMEELQVRLAAQRILTTNLRPEAPGFWQGISLDLTDAVLVEADFAGCRLADLVLVRTVFHGDTDFSRMRFEGNLWLDRVQFVGKFDISRANVDGDFRCASVTFSKSADFAWARFHGEFTLLDCRFHRACDFTEAHFNGQVLIDGVTFDSEVDFDTTQWVETARLQQSVFRAGASFRAAHFQRSINIHDCEFGDSVFFEEVVFSGMIKIFATDFNEFQHLEDCAFHGEVYVLDSVFSGLLVSASQFRCGARFKDSRFIEGLVMIGVTSDRPFRFIKARFADTFEMPEHVQAEFSDCVLTGEEPIESLPRGWAVAEESRQFFRPPMSHPDFASGSR